MIITESIMEELKIFVYAVAFGTFWTFVYDAVIILRKVLHHNNTAYLMEDVIYWALAIPCCVIAMFEWSKGVLYWYFLGGVLIGSLLYKNSLSKGYIKIATTIIQYIVVYIKRAVYFVLTPIRFLKKQLNTRIAPVISNLKKFTIIPKMWLTVCIKWFKIVLCKHKGTDSQVKDEGSLGETANGR